MNRQSRDPRNALYYCIGEEQSLAILSEFLPAASYNKQNQGGIV